MECRTASACAALEVSWCQLGNRESLGGESLLRRALRGILLASRVAIDDCEEYRRCLLRVWRGG